MRLIEIRLREFKGVHADVLFAPAMVFFGPNDAGKTNLLEAMEMALTGYPSLARRDPRATMESSVFGEGWISNEASDNTDVFEYTPVFSPLGFAWR